MEVVVVVIVKLEQKKKKEEENEHSNVRASIKLPTTDNYFPDI